MNNKIQEEIKKIKDEKEQLEVSREINKIDEYKNKLQLTNYTYDYEIQEFISNIINKYRYKIEVHNFYNAPAGQDEVSDQYNTLCPIEKMIAQYVSIKIANQSE